MAYEKAFLALIFTYMTNKILKLKQSLMIEVAFKLVNKPP